MIISVTGSCFKSGALAGGVFAFEGSVFYWVRNVGGGMGRDCRRAQILAG